MEEPGFVFGVGTGFVLVGLMFLQILLSAIRVDTTPQSLPARSSGKQPPFLMGVIFALMGSFAFFGEPSAGVPFWVGYAAGGLFVLCGLGMMACRLENKLYSKVCFGAAVVAFLAVFHWVSFGAGPRIGTSTTPFSHTSGVNVKFYFAAFTVLMDIVLLLGLIKWVRDKSRP